MLLLSTLFVVGYAFIALEHPLKVNKSATALVLGALLWLLTAVLRLGGPDLATNLVEHLADIAGLVFYLLGAMTIVEVVDAHDGFSFITARIRTNSLRKLLWIISLITFVLSTVLNNLTTTIVMITLLRKLVQDKNERLMFVGLIIIAANAGGAFSPIGDVTTTMLWLDGQVTSVNIIRRLFIPSLANVLIPLIIATFIVKGKAVPLAAKNDSKRVPTWQRTLALFLGIGLLIIVPVFTQFTGLPPYLGVLLALGILWATTDIIHRRKEPSEKQRVSLAKALLEIDHPSILFFVGILLAVATLQVSGVLTSVASFLDASIGNQGIIVAAMGLLSAILDNVPLVSALINMYPLSAFPTDHFIWEFIAYCAGTGGSILVIGSAAGVTAMGLEGISFGWFARRISPLALAGYAGGAGAYLFQRAFIGS